MVAGALSTFFSASETALFSLPVDEVRRLGDSPGTGRVIAHLLARPKRLLTTVLLGNMVANVVFYSVSLLLIVQHREALGPTRAALLGVAAPLFVITFGEVLPKNFAVGFARPVSRLAAYPLLVFEKALLPFIFLLERITDNISALFGGRLPAEPFIRTEELQMLIDLSAEEGVVDRDVGEMIAEVIKLSETALREVMVPRVEMACFDVDGPPEDLDALFRQSKHTLIPVYVERVDNMLGVVHAKDFLLRDEGTALRALARPIPFLPETATVEDVLHRFRKEHARMAFVVDEYGAVEGLVTIEDILEEIVGEITDEFDAEEAPPVERIDERRFRLRGDLSVREWHEAFQMDLPELSVDTIGGLVMLLLDRIPQAGDHVHYRNLGMTVERMQGRRVVSVILELGDGANGPPQDAGGRP